MSSEFLLLLTVLFAAMLVAGGVLYARELDLVRSPEGWPQTLREAIDRLRAGRGSPVVEAKSQETEGPAGNGENGARHPRAPARLVVSQPPGTRPERLEPAEPEPRRERLRRDTGLVLMAASALLLVAVALGGGEPRSEVLGEETGPDDSGNGQVVAVGSGSPGRESAVTPGATPPLTPGLTPPPETPTFFVPTAPPDRVTPAPVAPAAPAAPTATPTARPASRPTAGPTRTPPTTPRPTPTPTAAPTPTPAPPTPKPTPEPTPTPTPTPEPPKPPAPEIVTFAAVPATGPAPLDVVFTATFLGGTDWTIDFGDGMGSESGSGALAGVTHRYDKGSYTATLTVVGPGGSDAEGIAITAA